MSEWWSYRPSDFLMYSPRSWGRLLEGLHQELWPAQAIVFLLASVALAMAWRRPRPAVLPVGALLALAWAWVAGDFFWNRLAQISTGAQWMAVAAGMEVVLLVVLGRQESDATRGKATRSVGLGLAAIALFAWPPVAPLRGLGWWQSELPGLTPDATSLFTIGLLLALPLRHRPWLLAVPVALLAVGATMQWLLLVR